MPDRDTPADLGEAVQAPRFRQRAALCHVRRHYVVTAVREHELEQAVAGPDFEDSRLWRQSIEFHEHPDEIQQVMPAERPGQARTASKHVHRKRGLCFDERFAQQFDTVTPGAHRNRSS